MTLTFTDIFCGAGGSSLGLEHSGFELKLAANHWERAIQTHAANFRDADHLCADVSNYDMRRLPTTDLLWASPECTWHSPAGGRRRRRGQQAFFDTRPPTDAEIRSRATALDVIRATETHRYAAVLVENVIEFADWELFDWWLEAFRRLSPAYNVQTVCVSSAHIYGPGNEPAPQWRDRLYVVLTRQDVPIPNVEPRPLAWCDTCDELVEARQAWKKPNGRRIGKYGQQYLYRCRSSSCRHAIVEPFVLPAAAAIDWTDLGTRIGDRKRPLAEATMQRIRLGLELFAEPITIAAGGNSWERPGSDYVRAWPTTQTPLNTRTKTSSEAVVAPFLVSGYSGGVERRIDPATQTPLRTIVANGRGHHGLAVPEPFITMLRAHNRARGLDEPLAALMTATHHALTVPPGAFYVKNFTPRGRGTEMVKDATTTPLGAITTKDHHSLVIPYRRGRAKTTAEPLHTLATRESAALVHPTVRVEDCHFRMLAPREHLRGQRFPDDYIVTGNKGEQTAQAGNAVSANVAQWLGEKLAQVLA